MKKQRLTPKQMQNLRTAANIWGPCFQVYSDFMVKKGLVRYATISEKDQHYAEIGHKLRLDKEAICEAVRGEKWNEARRIMAQAEDRADELNNRAMRALYVLTAYAHTLLDNSKEEKQ